jgi:hypothetical protein
MTVDASAHGEPEPRPLADPQLHPPIASPGASPTERRSNRDLRELLDEMIGHVRDLARHSPTLTAAQLEYAQQRLEWLADEIWDSATRHRE